MLSERIKGEGRVSIYEALDGNMRKELDTLLAEGKVKLKVYGCDIYGANHSDHAYIEFAG